MSDLTGEAQIRMGVEGDHPLVVDAGTASGDVFGAMADERRRHVLAVLSDESTAMDVSTVVERVADRLTTEEDSEAASELTTRRLSASLHHRHLPKMESAGLVEYDTENRTIEATQAMK